MLLQVSSRQNKTHRLLYLWGSIDLGQMVISCPIWNLNISRPSRQAITRSVAVSQSRYQSTSPFFASRCAFAARNFSSLVFVVSYQSVKLSDQ